MKDPAPALIRPADGVNIPLEIVTRRTAVFGVSGSGKSNSAVRIIELLLEAGEQVVYVDPKGDGWGLRTSADGKSPGFAVIVFGQPHGDIPEISEEHAEEIADFVVDSGRSVVLSLLGFDSDQQERKFVTRFFKRLYRRKSQQAPKTRTLVVLEEAHLFIPEQASGANGEMVGAIKRIARQGRSAGLGLMVVDQRPQDVAKSVISQCELLITHQLVHKLDRDALRDWIRAYDRDNNGDEFLRTLAELAPGEAWVWSPAWLLLFVRVKMQRRVTYDSGATPSGTHAITPTARAAVDLPALRAHLATVVRTAKENDPAALKARVAELEAKLGAAYAGEALREPADPVIEYRDRVPARVREPIDALLPEIEQLADMTHAVRSMYDKIVAAAAKFDSADIDPPARAPAPPAGFRPDRFRGDRRPDPNLPAGRDGDGDGAASAPTVKMPPGELAILRALATYAPSPVDRTTIGVLTGYKRSSRDQYISRVAAKGYAAADGSTLAITADGRKALGRAFKPMPTGAALYAWWAARLPEGEAKILEIIRRGYPRFVDTDKISDATGYLRSSRDQYLSRLASRKLITRGRGGARAADVLFDRPIPETA